MALLLNDEQNMLADAARGFISQSLPVKHLRDLRDKTPDARTDLESWTAMAEMGWAGILVGEDDGGVGLGCLEAGLVAVELGRTLGTAPLTSCAVLAATALSGATSKDTGLLGEIAEGKKLVCFADQAGTRHSEGLEGLDGTDNEVTGTRSYVLDGMAADLAVVAGLFDGAPALWLVDLNGSGVARRAGDMSDARPVAHITFEAAQATLLAKGDAAADLLQNIWARGRAVLAAEMLGSAEAAFEMTTEYLKDRKQFGVSIGSFQALQHRAAHLLSELENLRSLVLAALSALDDKPERAARLAAAAKAKAGHVAVLTGQEAVQMHGGIGMTDEHDIGLYLKRIRANSLILGDVHQMRDKFASLSGY